MSVFNGVGFWIPKYVRLNRFIMGNRFDLNSGDSNQ